LLRYSPCWRRAAAAGQFTPIGNPEHGGHIGEGREGIEIATDDKPREMPPEVAHQVLSRLALFAAHRAT